MPNRLSRVWFAPYRLCSGACLVLCLMVLTVCLTAGAFAQTPSPPTGVTATAGNAQVTLSWTASSGATSYSAYRGTSAGGESTTAIASGITTTSYVDSTVTNGTKYYYKLKATNSSGTSGYSSEVNATPLAPPGAPTSVTATMQSSSSIKIAWTAPTGTVSSYNLYQSTTTGGEGTTPVATGITATNYTVTGLSTNTVYYFKVAGVNVGGVGTQSSEASTTTATAAPTGLSATAASTSQINLTWSSVTGATSYNVYRGTSSGGESSTATATGLTTTSYSNTGISSATTYYYTVKAVNAGGASAASNEASADTLPGTPTSLHATASTGQVALTWTAPSGTIGSYKIYRSSTSGGEGTTPYQTGITSASYTDTGVSTGIYYYKVSAVNASGAEGAQSSEASAAFMPAAPTGLTATGGSKTVSLSWTASNPGSTYSVYRGTTSGGESATAIRTGLTVTTYSDTGLTNGYTYYYYVKASNSAGLSAASNEASAQCVGAVYQINSGGSAVSPFVSDTDYTATVSYTDSVSTTIDTSAVTNPAPQNVYHTQRYTSASNTITYTLPGLAAGSYTVRLHFADLHGSSAGADSSTVSINGTQVLTNFDPVAAAGGPLKAIVEQFNATPDGSGNITIVLQGNGSGWNGICGIEVVTGSSSPAPPLTLYAAPANASVYLSWPAVSGATSYNLYRGTSTGGETLLQSGLTGTSYTNVGLTNGTTYYYYLTAVNTYGEGSKSPEISATPQASGAAVYRINAGGGAVSPFSADEFFDGNSSESSNSTTVSTTGVTNPAPMAVYQSSRITENSFVSDQFSYSFACNLPGLQPSAYYTVRLHFATGSSTAIGQNIFNVLVNGTPVLVNYDVAAAAGAAYQAVVAQFDAPADATGAIHITFQAVLGSASIDGIEVLGSTNGTPAIQLQASGAANRVTLTWTSVSGAAEYDLYRGTSPGGENATPYATNVSSPYIDYDLNNGTPYYYVIKAPLSGGGTAVSNEAAAAACAPLPAPTNLTCQYDRIHDTMFLQWDSVPGASEYRIYSTLHHGGPYLNNDMTSIAPSIEYIGGVYNGGYYVVTAVGPSGCSESGYSNEAGYSPGNPTVGRGQTLTEPGTVSGNCPSTGTWDVLNSYGAEIATSINPNGWNVTVTADHTISVTVPPNAPFDVYCTARIENTAAGTCDSLVFDVVATQVPTGLTATPGDSQVTLSWAAQAADASYNIYYNSNGGTTFSPLVSGVTGTSYVHTGLANGTTYYYAVTGVGVNGGGESAPSVVVSATPETSSNAPTLAATSGTGQTTLTWTNASGITYNVYRGTARAGESNTPYALGVTSPYTDTGVSNGTEYFYMVSAVSGGSESFAPNEAFAGPVGFGMTCNPNTVTITHGTMGTVTLNVTSSGNFSGAVAPALSGLPTGASPWFYPASANVLFNTAPYVTIRPVYTPAVGSSTLYLFVASTTALGTYPITVTGTNGSEIETATFTLVVN